MRILLTGAVFGFIRVYIGQGLQRSPAAVLADRPLLHPYQP